MANPGWEIIKQGAEAKVYKIDFYGRPAIVKERFPKTYRHPTLDSRLSQRRMVQEARCLNRCQLNGIDSPTIYFLDPVKNLLYEEYVDGTTVKETLFSVENVAKDSSACQMIDGVMEQIGASLAKMHDADIIHGDLTTSNMILRQSSEKAFIDFGLGYSSSLFEDKAVDLYVLDRAFLSTHPNSKQMFTRVLETYSNISKNGEQVIKRFVEVRKRGRKRDMTG